MNVNNNVFKVFLFLIFIPNIIFADELTKGKKDTIIIGKTRISSSVEASSKKRNFNLELQRAKDALDVEFVNAINSTQVFQVVERDRKEALEVEQAYSNIAVNPDDKDVAQMFKMAGGKFVLLPEMNAFDIKVSKINYKAIERTSESRQVFVSVVAKVVDTTTGKILSESPSVQMSTTESVSLARMGTTAGSDQAILFLMKDVANGLAQKIVTYLKPAKVLTITGKQVMINRGLRGGIKVGDTVEFYAVEDVTDEDTGEVFANEILVGSGTVIRGDEKKCFAKIEGEDLGITKGVLVKIKKKAIKKVQVKAIKKEVSTGSSEKPLQF